MTTFSEDDVGKRVETADGARVGTVAAINGGTVYVDLDPGARDSIKATLGWETADDDVVPIASEDVREVTAEVLRVEVPAEPGHDDAAETDGDRSGERRSSTRDAPPAGDRTVTEDRGREEDR